MTQKITVIRGDGIGPEIMDATLHVLDQLGAGLEYEFADAGVVALEKHGDLMPKETLDSIARNRVARSCPGTRKEITPPRSCLTVKPDASMSRRKASKSAGRLARATLMASRSCSLYGGCRSVPSHAP